VPVSIITGWLGAGKTTLIQHILKEMQQKSKKLAIINNEVAATGIERPMSVLDPNSREVLTEVVELGGGCVCCSVRDDFVVGLEVLLRKRRFDYILVECSGVANPGPLASIFWLDSELESAVALDAVIAVVDARTLRCHLSSNHDQARQIIHQIGFADRVVLNKADLLADAAEMEELRGAVQRINALADVMITQNSAVPLSFVLDVRAFAPKDAAAVAQLPNPFLKSPSPAVQPEAAHHQHGSSVATDPHDHSITTVVLEETQRPIRLELLHAWLQRILWTDSRLFRPAHGPYFADDASSPASSSSSPAAGSPTPPLPFAKREENGGQPVIFRCKGLLWLAAEAGDEPVDSARRYYLQGVHELYEIESGDGWHPDRPFSRLVFIGRHLNRALLQQGLESTLAARQAPS